MSFYSRAHHDLTEQPRPHSPVEAQHVTIVSSLHKYWQGYQTVPKTVVPDSPPFYRIKTDLPNPLSQEFLLLVISIILLQPICSAILIRLVLF